MQTPQACGLCSGSSCVSQDENVGADAVGAYETFLELSATAGGDVEEAACNLLRIRSDVICSGPRPTQYDRLKYPHPWGNNLEIKLVEFQGLFVLRLFTVQN